MDTDYLRTFVFLAETKSYQKTAEALYISRATISHRIQRLTAAVGFDPFISRRNDIALTSKGLEFLEIAREMIRLEDKAAQLGNDRANQIDIRIGAGEMIAMTQILPLLRNLKKRFPNVSYIMDTNNYIGIKEKMLHGSLDVAITWNEPDLSSLNKKRLCACYSGALMTENHPLAHQKELLMKEVLKYPLILRQENTMSRRVFSNYVAKHHVKYNVAHEVTNSSALESMLLHGFDGENAVSLCTTLFSLETTSLVWRRISDVPASDTYMYVSKELANEESIHALYKALNSRMQDRMSRVFDLQE